MHQGDVNLKGASWCCINISTFKCVNLFFFFTYGRIHYVTQLDIRNQAIEELKDKETL